MRIECRQIREQILRASHVSGHGHIPTCFSIVECLWSIYHTMRHNPKDPAWSERDLFILSKGHGALAHYCVLADAGYFDVALLDSFGSCGSDYGCHADKTKVAGVEWSTGSLGHGIGVAVGMALAMKIQGSTRKVYTLIGDGESNEGSVWEAVMVAANLQLKNLTVIFDNNRSQLRGLQIRKPYDIFKAFGCQVFQVDGHNADDIRSALQADTDTVKVIVADTVKGYGCDTLADNQYEWHRRSPNDQEMKILLEELREKAV